MDKKNIQDILSLTPTQEGMLYHYLKESQRNLYFAQLCLEIAGEPDVQRFTAAWNFVVKTNEMLRASFRWEKVKAPLQIILKESSIELHYYNFSDKADSEKVSAWEEIKKQDRERGFDLKDIPFRITLCKMDDALYQVIISHHHILYDGWSNGIILTEFFETYNELCRGKSLKELKPPVKTRFGKFVKWLEVNDQDEGKKAAEVTFWKEYLAGFDGETGILLKPKISPDMNEPGENKVYCIDPGAGTHQSLDDFTARYNITPAVLFYSAWGLLLQKYNNCEDVLFGTTVSGRSAKIPGIEKMVGLFINTLPLRVRFYEGETILELLRHLNDSLLVREAYEYTPLVKINQYSPGSTNKGPFDSIVVVENYPLDIRQLQESSPLTVNSYSIMETPHYDLTVVIQLSESIDIHLSYQSRVFAEGIIQQLGSHFLRLVQVILENPHQDIFEIDILSNQEKQQILEDFNNTDADYPRDKTIHQLFEEQVEQTPDYIALHGCMIARVHDVVEITYGELNERSNQLAYLWRERGVGADIIVAIMIERSVEMIIGLLGILKAGAAYLPIDPEYPGERIDFMLKDSNVGILLTTPKLRVKLKNKVEERFTGIIDILNLSSSSTLTSTSTCQVSPANLAYIIYTSGSTGRPKGVMVQHGNVLRLLVNDQSRFDFNNRDTWTMFHSFCFDFSVWEMYGALLYGGKLIVIPKMAAMDTAMYLEILKEQDVTVLNQTPSAFYNLMELKNPGKGLSLRYVIFGGEALNPGKLSRWKARYRQTKLVNMYGITETTVHVTYKEIEDREIEAGISNIGKPIPTLRVYVMDKYLHLQGIGIAGELCVGGDGVARGYLNNPELTAEKFDHDFWDYQDYQDEEQKKQKGAGKNHMQSPPHHSPQHPITPLPHSPIYRTGDLGRWLEDGDIEFLGRIDQQVKIRGFRIELGEIEGRLVKHDAIKEAVVVASPGNAASDSADKYLCAYVISENKSAASLAKTSPLSIAGELKTYLAEVLPGYMIPTYFVELESFPLTPNGKINRQALPVPEIKTKNRYTTPRNNIEKKLAEIWADVLNINHGDALPGSAAIGIEDNFFQIGGHSLKAAALMAKIHKAFNVRIPLAEVFERPTIEEIAQFIQANPGNRYRAIPMVEDREYYRSSSAQKRLFILQQSHPDNIGYNISTVLLLEGDLDRKQLNKTFSYLVRRHESFRTSFAMVEDEPVQRVHKKVEFEIEYDRSLVNGHWSLGNCQGRGEVSSPIKVEKITKSFIRPFDLSRESLLRVGLKKVEEKKFLLMVDMHHIISDGTSVTVMVKEFMALYKGETLPTTVIRYRDYARWLQSNTWKKTIKTQENYWLKVFETDVPLLNLPVDYTRPVNRGYEGDRLIFEIGEEGTNRLKALAFQQEMTLFMVLLAIYNVLLGKLGNQDDLVVGTGTAGRNHENLHPVIGMFINTLALRNYPREHKTFKEFLKEVRVCTLKAFENQEYPFEDLVDRAAKTDTSRNPLFDVMFQMENIDSPGIEIPGIKLYPLDYQRKVSKFDLTLRAIEKEGRLSFSMEYGSRLFKAETIGYFAHYFKEYASSAAVGPDRRLWEITAVPETRKQEILSQLDTTLEHEVGGFEKETGNSIFQDRLNRWLKKFADSTAIEYGDSTITRKQLDKCSNHIANRILQKGIQKNAFIGILIEDRVEFINVMLAILKAGRVFVPLDSSLPPRRLERMMAAVEIKYVLAEAANSKQLEVFNSSRSQEQEVEFIFIHHLFPGFPEGETDWFTPPPEVANSRQDNVYVYFTSGSTGNPKAIVGKNKSLLHFIHWEIETLDIHEGSRVSQLINPGFDAFLRDIFVPLCSGGVICIPGSRDMIWDPVRLTQWIDNCGIHLIHCVPAFFRILISAPLTGDNLKTLKYVLLSGERINPSDLSHWYAVFNRRIKVVNLWGSTETTMAKTCYFIKESDLQRERIPVGKPIKGTNVMVLDNRMNICDVLITGELYIRTPFRTSGYYNEPGLNMQQFIPNPFADAADIAGEEDLLCKTGDLGRLLPDGNIELLGRKDFQVKIRGIRVELGEIENRLQSHPGIKETVVLAREGGSDYADTYLCAYVVPVERGTFGNTPAMTGELKNHLSEELPGYMIPSYFIQLEKIPLTANGKIDRKALPEPGVKTGTPYAPPGDEIEKKLVEIWSEVLGMEKSLVGIDNNFFEMGGHSLKAVILTARFQKESNIKLPLAEIFEKPTIRRISRYIRGKTRDEDENKYTVINPGEKRDYYALSSARKRLYFLHRMDPGSTGYNRPLLLALEGHIEKNRLEAAIKKLISRHESLRTWFVNVNEVPIQRVHDEIEFEIEYYCAERKAQSGERKEERNAPCAMPYASTIKDFIRPFDLSCLPLLRVGLIREEEQKHLLVFDMHHIISDGVSDYILSRDFMALYSGEDLPGLRLHYKDYAQWQGQPARQAVLERQKTFWLKQFQGEIPVLNLPIDYPRPAIRGFAGRMLAFQIGEERTWELKKLAAGENVTLYMLLLALYNIFLVKITGQDDIVVGTPVAGRPHTDLQEIVGFFVNTLPLRNYPKPGKTFREFLTEVKTLTGEALENQEYPFERLVDKVGVKRDTSRNPLFDAVFAILNFERTEIKIPGLTLKPYEYEIKTSKFDLSLQGMDRGPDFMLMLEYSTKIFKPETIERFRNYFLKLLEAVSPDAGISIADMDILPGQEKRQLLVEFNDNRSPYPADKTITELFKEQVERTPDHVAVVGPLENKYRTYMSYMTYISYRELNEISHRLAHLLIENGVRLDNIVAIMMERSVEMIITLLAILKAGGAYLPIDPEYPQERIDYMLKDSGVEILLTKKEIISSPQAFNNRLKGTSSFGIWNLEFGISPRQGGQLAYIIYTSGSTGRPKGVMIGHQNVARLVKHSNFIPLLEGERLLMTGSIAFDISTFEIWTPLLNGLTLVLTTGQDILELERLAGKVKKHHISILHLIPQLFNQIAAENLEVFTGLKYFLVGGDLVMPHHVNRLQEKCPGLTILHMYGPTENTTFSTSFQVDKSYEHRLPIGKPISNSVVYILDSLGGLVPIGVVGELCVGGDGISRGYLNNPGLTAEKFCLRRPGGRFLKKLPPWTPRKNFSLLKGTGKIIQCSHASMQPCNHAAMQLSPHQSPHYPITPLPHSPIYRTGDLGRWLPDGNIEFLGRRDYQVKIRGFRIELEEIENQLLRHEKIKEAAAVMKEHDQYLCAYVVPGTGGVFSETTVGTELKEFLSHTLPRYMIPHHFVLLDKMPLTASGKVDRKALPDTEYKTGEDYTAPQNRAEKILVEIWSGILGIEEKIISIDADFFELGGHSLRAFTLINEIHKVLEVKITLPGLFQRPTIRGLANYINASDISGQEQYAPIQLVEEKEYYPLSSSQRQFYILQYFEKDSTAYNIRSVLWLEGELDRQRLEKTFLVLIKRHEILHTFFLLVNREPVQVVTDNVKFKIDYYEPGREGTMAEDIIRNYIRPFDLSAAPLFRVGLIKVEKEKHIFLMDMHHIVTDGTSMAILIKEFNYLYNTGEEKKLPLLKMRYRDFSQWQNQEEQRDKLKQQQEWWLNEFPRLEEIPLLNLPLDYRRIGPQTFQGHRVGFIIDEKETAALKTLASREKVTLFMVLLAFCNVLLSKVCRQEDIVLGTPVVARKHADLVPLVGLFLNTLVLRNFPARKKSFREFLHQVKERTLNAFRNKDYPYEDLVSKLSPTRNTGGNSIFDFLFVLQNTGAVPGFGSGHGYQYEYLPETVSPGLTFKPYPVETMHSLFDMIFLVFPTREKLDCSIFYRTDLFKPGTIRRIIENFKEILSAVLNNSDIRLQDIEVSRDWLAALPGDLLEDEGDFGF